MDQILVTIVEETLRMRCVYTLQGVLRNNHFFQDERVVDDVMLSMSSGYFQGRQKGLYGVVREVETKKPVVDLFFLHECFRSDVSQDAICQMNLDYISGGDMRIPLEDPLTAEEVNCSLFDGTYKPLIDARPELNASWVRVKPYYAFEPKKNVEQRVYEQQALTESMKHIRIFLEGYRPLKRLFVDVDFSLHNPLLFSQFLVGAEFSFADNIEGVEKLVERAREVYGFLRC